MLRIYYGDPGPDNYVFNPGIYFNNTYEDDWITSSLSRAMIRDVDKAEVVSPRLIESPFLGPIPPESLSGGVRALILMSRDREHIFNASVCGDNCAQWILKIAEDRELTIRLGYMMNFGEDEFDIEVVNLAMTVHTMKELSDAVLSHSLI